MSNAGVADRRNPSCAWLGVVDCLGYLVCRRCNEAGHGHSLEQYVFGAPHSEERCDYCASLLCNDGEP